MMKRKGKRVITVEKYGYTEWVWDAGFHAWAYSRFVGWAEIAVC